jgi:hypothetical protein
LLRSHWSSAQTRSTDLSEFADFRGSINPRCSSPRKHFPLHQSLFSKRGEPLLGLRLLRSNVRRSRGIRVERTLPSQPHRSRDELPRQDPWRDEARRRKDVIVDNLMRARQNLMESFSDLPCFCSQLGAQRRDRIDFPLLWSHVGLFSWTRLTRLTVWGRPCSERAQKDELRYTGTSRLSPTLQKQQS